MSIPDRPNGRTAVVVDIDGTLADVNPFLHLVHQEVPDYAGFHEQTNAHGRPVAWVVNLCRTAHAQGHQVIALTGRSHKHFAGTRDWLNRHVPVPLQGPIMRPEKDFRADRAIKREALAALRAAGFTVVGAIDDRPQVLDLWRESGIDPVVSLRPDWADAGEHYTDADLAAWADQEALRRAHGWRQD